MAIIEVDYGEVGFGGESDRENPFTPNTNTFTEIEIGFVPKRIILYFNYDNVSPLVIDFDVENNHLYRCWSSTFRQQTDSYIGVHYKIEGTKLYVQAPASAYAKPTYWVAA